MNELSELERMEWENFKSDEKYVLKRCDVFNRIFDSYLNCGQAPDEAYAVVCKLFDPYIVKIEECNLLYEKFKLCEKEKNPNYTTFYLCRNDLVTTDRLLAYASNLNLEGKYLKALSERGKQHVLEFITTFLDISFLTEYEIARLHCYLTLKTPYINLFPYGEILFIKGTTLASVFYEGGYKSKYELEGDLFSFILNELNYISYLVSNNQERYSLHDTLCDAFHLNPDTTNLTSEPLMRLPFFKHMPEYFRNYANNIHNYLLKYFDGKTLRETSWDEKSYVNTFYTYINEKKDEAMQLNNAILISPNKSSRKDIHCDLFLYALDLFLKHLMLALSQDRCSHTVQLALELYAKLWDVLMSNLNEIVTKMKENFKEKRRRFPRILKDGHRYWKKIWFDNEAMPLFILHLYNESISKNTDLTGIIMPSIVRSYKMLGIYEDDIKSDPEKITPLEFYHFMKWHLRKYPPAWLSLITESSEENDTDDNKRKIIKRKK